MISIIVPVYNCEKYISRCINAILQQSYQDFEIIIIDDGSNDNSRKICDEFAYADSRIRVIHQQNKGVSETRNNGLRHAEGTHIAFIDADDYIDYDYLEKLMKGFDVGADISYCSAIDEDENYNIVGVNMYANNKIIKQSDFDWNGELQHSVVWGAIYKKEITDGIYFDKKYYVGEDTLFWAQCLKKARYLYYTCETNYHYVLYKESASHGSFDEKRITELMAWKHIYKIWNNSSVSLAYCTRIMALSKRYSDSSEFSKNYFDKIISEYRQIYKECLVETIKTKRYKSMFTTLLFYVCPKIYVKFYNLLKQTSI